MLSDWAQSLVNWAISFEMVTQLLWNGPISQKKLDLLRYSDS